MTTDIGPLPEPPSMPALDMPFNVYTIRAVEKLHLAWMTHCNQLRAHAAAERTRTYALGIEHGRAQAARIVREAAAHGLCCSDCDALADLIERARDVE